MPTLTLNGEILPLAPDHDGYLSIRRTWKSGDTVELNLPMPVHRVQAHGNLTENNGRIALMRGPIVYCLEGVDQQGVDLFSLTLPKDAVFKTEHRPGLLNGVTVLQTEAIDRNGKPTPVTAIPYFAWANRGKSPMVIWLNESKPAITN